MFDDGFVQWAAATMDTFEFYYDPNPIFHFQT